MENAPTDQGTANERRPSQPNQTPTRLRQIFEYFVGSEEATTAPEVMLPTNQIPQAARNHLNYNLGSTSCHLVNCHLSLNGKPMDSLDLEEEDKLQATDAYFRFCQV